MTKLQIELQKLKCNADGIIFNEFGEPGTILYCWRNVAIVHWWNDLEDIYYAVLI